jgi:hypothetical protein
LNIHIVFVVSIPVSVVVAGIDIFRRPISFLFPNSDYSASFSSSVEDRDEESVDSATDAHANCDLCSILSTEDLYHNKNMGYIYNKPNPDRNTVSDTTDLPTDATTNPPRKRCLPPHQGQRRHTYPVSLWPQGVREIRWVAAVAEKFQYLYRHPLASWQERHLSKPRGLRKRITFSSC